VKTVNLSLPEEVWKAARIEAAKHNTSLSGLVRCYLRAMVQGKAPIITEDGAEDSEKQNRQALVKALRSTDLVLGFEPSRSRTYER